ncbi:MAG: hydroxymyristoyl-ACP dehydratase [Bacteroides sp.]|nr:hydroxymyristoyl-ACP dehydratase [Bacteroides sp.]MCM1555834.1 hydroxymyristoyl-ACP dehydratase [Bacteroides sp.]
MQEEVLKLIPQRPPIVMIDGFGGMDEAGVSHTVFTVRSRNMFCEDGKLSECGLIEHMAQSAAARAGWLALQKGEKVRLGFIGSVNNFEVNGLPCVGQELRTEVSVVQEVFGISLVRAVVFADGGEIARGEMKIVLEDAAQ